MKEEPFDGGCLCGAIRYRASSAPVRAVICHCSMCRKHSGAPALCFVHFPLDCFSWLGEVPTRYRSSKFAERGFCPFEYQKQGRMVALSYYMAPDEALEDPVELAQWAEGAYAAAVRAQGSPARG